MRSRFVTLKCSSAAGGDGMRWIVLSVCLLSVCLLAGCALEDDVQEAPEDTLACPDADATVTADPPSPAHREDVAFSVDGPDALATVWLIGGEPATPAHVFETPGPHHVEARLFTAAGCVVVAAHELDVRNDAPMAHFEQHQVNDRIYLDARASTDRNGDALTYAWAFDGEPVGEGSVEEILPTPADGTVIRLVVMDPWGGEDRYQQVVAAGG